LVKFIDQLTNTYIRLNRSRFWKSPDPLDQADAYHTLHAVLTTFAQVLAPFMPFLTEEVYQRLVRPIDANAPASVHWCDYPQANTQYIDADLERDVAIGLTVASLGRKLREDHKLKVRQPLSAVTVISRDAQIRSGAERFSAAIALELNVKNVHFSADEAAFCAITVKPNLKVLGKRCGPKLKAISSVLSTWSFAEVATLEAGTPITVEGEAITIADLLLTRSPVAGAITASQGAVSVALDTTLNHELILEGLAREIISVLQQARKDAGLDVADRITLRWHSDDADLIAAITAHQQFICDEVLATSISKDAQATATVDINNRPIQYQITKA
jgi:isoleucyl-tRNA synthetase